MAGSLVAGLLVLVSALAAQPADMRNAAQAPTEETIQPEELALVLALLPTHPQLLILPTVLQEVNKPTPPQGISPGPERKLPRLIAALQHPNPLVRKHAVRILEQMEPPANDAIPAVFELLQKEPSVQVRQACDRFLDQESFTSPIKMQAFASCVSNVKEPAGRRITSCRALMFLYQSKFLGPEHKKTLREVLADAVADRDEDIQLAGALALEGIDRVDAASLRQLVVLDLELLRGNKLTMPELLKTIQKAQPAWKLQLIQPNIVQIQLSSTNEILLVDEVPVRQTEGDTLLLKELRSRSNTPAPAP